MIKITFEIHATAQEDGALSPEGIKQAQQLGKRYANRKFDAVYCSTLKRSYKTAEIAFENKDIHILQDARLRDDDVLKTVKSVREFLKELITDYNDTQVMIIGHRSTQQALEHFINKTPIDKAASAPWKWQPGWTYYLKNLQG